MKKNVCGIYVKNYKNILIGTWKDENSTYTMNSNGTYSITFNSGKSAGKTKTGTWSVHKSDLIKTYDVSHVSYDYTLSDVCPDSFTEYNNETGNIYHATRGK
jgi:hypothetical protein